MLRKTKISAVLSALIANDAISDVNPEMIASGLVRIETKAYEADYPAITLDKILPIQNLEDPTATSFGYAYVTKAGKAQLSRPDGKIAWIDTFVGMKQAPLHDGDTGYKFTTKELARASMTGAKLQTYKPKACITASLQLAQDIAYNGDETRDIDGFFTNPDIASVSPTVGANGDTWALKTPEEIVSDVNHLFGTAFATTKQVEFKPQDPTIRLMLPTLEWSRIANTKMSANSDKTILSFLVENCEYLTSKDQVIPSPDIASDKMRAYHFDEDKVHFVWGHMIDFKSPQHIDNNIQVPAEFSIGGTVIVKPLSVWDMDGIA